MSEHFVKALAAPRPVPGGGAASAHGARVGVALLEKIILLELDRHGIDSTPHDFWSGLLESVTDCTEALIHLRDTDGAAYLAWAEARRSGVPADQQAALLQDAVECPLRIMEEGNSALNLVRQAALHCRKHLLSDLMVVSELVQAGIRGASHIARANLVSTEQYAEKEQLSGRLLELNDQCRQTCQEIEHAAHARATH